MKKILLLSAHPDIKNSKACAAMLKAAQELSNVKVKDLYQIPLEVENYLEDVKNADVLVFQFPLWWGSAPSMLKSWLDSFMLGFMENPGMKGKQLLVAITAGVGAEEYRAGGAEQFTLDEILRPFQVTAIYTGMTYLRPFAIYGTMAENAEENISNGVKEYKSLLENL